MKQNGTKRLTISYLALTAALLALFMLNILRQHGPFAEGHFKHAFQRGE